MPVYEPFFKRQKRLRGEFPEVFQTENMPLELVAHLRRIFFETTTNSDNIVSWVGEEILEILSAEAPLFFIGLKDYYAIRYIFDRVDYNAEMILSAIELMCIIVSKGYYSKAEDGLWLEKTKNDSEHFFQPKQTLKTAIAEINIRFREAGYGYQIQNNQIIPIDSEFTHAEIVVPTLILLKEKEFEPATEEFFGAFDDYKRGSFRDCIKKCGDALDSTLKIIFAGMGWTPPANKNVAPYIREAGKHGLYPDYLTNHYNNLADMIINGPPTMRNQNGGHGQGTQIDNTPDFFARYMINMTASTILFFINAYHAKKK